MFGSQVPRVIFTRTGQPWRLSLVMILSARANHIISDDCVYLENAQPPYVCLENTKFAILSIRLDRIKDGYDSRRFEWFLQRSDVEERSETLLSTAFFRIPNVRDHFSIYLDHILPQNCCIRYLSSWSKKWPSKVDLSLRASTSCASMDAIRLWSYIMPKS